MKWVCSPEFYGPLANWPWLRISLHSSLNVIYCLIITVWQWLMNFTCIPVQTEPNESPLRNTLRALLLWETGHLSSPSRSCLGRLILICGGWGCSAGRAPPHQPTCFTNIQLDPLEKLIGETSIKDLWEINYVYRDTSQIQYTIWIS